MISRGKAREFFMQMMFEMEAQNEYSETIKEKYLKEHVDDKKFVEYFNTLFLGITKNISHIDQQIESCSHKWKIDRMARVDLAILRLAAGEIFYIDDIPPSVSINEAVDLAKKFGTEDSGKFVNGILGNLVKQGKDTSEEKSPEEESPAE